MSRVAVFVCALAALFACAAADASLEDYHSVSVNHIYEEKLRALCEHEHSTNSCIELFMYQYRLPLIIGGAILAFLVLLCVCCCCCCFCRKRYHSVSQA